VSCSSAPRRRTRRGSREAVEARNCTHGTHDAAPVNRDPAWGKPRSRAQTRARKVDVESDCAHERGKKQTRKRKTQWHNVAGRQQRSAVTVAAAAAAAAAATSQKMHQLPVSTRRQLAPVHVGAHALTPAGGAASFSSCDARAGPGPQRIVFAPWLALARPRCRAPRTPWRAREPAEVHHAEVASLKRPAAACARLRGHQHRNVEQAAVRSVVPTVAGTPAGAFTLTVAVTLAERPTVAGAHHGLVAPRPGEPTGIHECQPPGMRAHHARATRRSINHWQQAKAREFACARACPACRHSDAHAQTLRKAIHKPAGPAHAANGETNARTRGRRGTRRGRRRTRPPRRTTRRRPRRPRRPKARTGAACSRLHESRPGSCIRRRQRRRQRRRTGWCRWSAGLRN
jgi:hypothetical protein